MSLPSLKELKKCSIMQSSRKQLQLYPTDELIVFMQPRCPDSKAVRDMLRALDFTAENGRVAYVNVHAKGRLMTTAFQDAGKGSYPSYDSDTYAAMNKKFGDVLPKLFRVGLGGKLDPTLYFKNHSKGLKEITLSN